MVEELALGLRLSLKRSEARRASAPSLLEKDQQMQRGRVREYLRRRYLYTQDGVCREFSLSAYLSVIAS